MPQIFEFTQNGRNFIYDTFSCKAMFAEDYLPVSTNPALGEIVPLAKNNLCKIKFMSLHVAHECPLYCEYCYGNGGTYNDSSQSQMSEATMRQSVNYLFTHCTDEEMVHINFFGGEPLMAFQLIKNTVAYSHKLAETNGKRIEYSVSTSALILNKEILTFLAVNHFSVSVSIDCDKDSHNRHRKFRNGTDSYEKVVEGYRQLLAYGIKTLITATLTHFTFEKINNYRKLMELGSDNFRFKNATGKLGELTFTPEDYTALASQYEKLAYMYCDDILRGKVYDFGDFTKWIYRLKAGNAVHYNCTATENYVNVDPSGVMYICHKFVGLNEGKLGSVYDIDKTIKALNFDTAFSKCSDCWANTICGGGCYYDGFAEDSNPYHTFGTQKCKIHQAQICGAIYIYCMLKRKGCLESFLHQITSSGNIYQLTV